MAVLNAFRLFKYIKHRHVRYNISRNVITLHERGIYQDIFPSNSSNDVTKMLSARKQCVYAGFDPTADSLHVGNLLVLMGLLHWQRAGHDVIALVGSATGRIGDPSGHNTSRIEIARNILENNIFGLKANIKQIFDNHHFFLWKSTKRKLGQFMLVDNGDWYKEVNAAEFVGAVCRHLRLGTLLSRNSVQSRLSSEAGMSLAELCYQAFQAYDWLHLYQKYNCRFQLGGADQMGNIMSGHELISRLHNKPVYGFTMPLVTSQSGEKLGKSAGNAVWLREHRTSPFEFYQYFLRTADSEVERLLRLFTFDTQHQIEEVMKKQQEQPEKRIAQNHLAEKTTLLVHGATGLDQALRVTSALYGGSLEELSALKPSDIALAFSGAQLVKLLLEPGLTVLQLAMKASCFRSEKDALRIITAGGFHINETRIKNSSEVVTYGAHILSNDITILRVGKKNYYIVQWLK